MTTGPDTAQPDCTQIVVVTREKRRRLAVPLVAAVAGAVLLGGTTFTMWSANDELKGGDIVAGDLNIDGPEAAAFYDVSTDRSDATTVVPGTGSAVKGHLVGASWRIVPGDTVAAVFDAEVTLEGDNLVAKLSLDGLGAGSRVNTGMTYTYAVYQAGTERVAKTTLPDGDDALLLYLAAPETGQGGSSDAAPAGSPVVHGMVANTEKLTVVVYGTFSSGTSGEDQCKVTDTLGSLTLRLEQVRNAGAVFP